MFSKFEISNLKLTEKEPGIIKELLMTADNLELVFIAPFERFYKCGFTLTRVG